MNQIRTINEAYQQIKTDDPNTALSKHYIRQILTDGTVPTIKCGAKTLVNMELLYEFLYGNRNTIV